MRLVTSGEARELDRQAQDAGVSGLALMEAAACKAAIIARAMLQDETRRRVLVLAGRGNNGGDGLAMARHLRNAGIAVRVYFCGRPEGLPPEAAANLSAWNNSGGHCAFAAGPQTNPGFWEALGRDLDSWAALVVDALLGVGQARGPGDDIGRAVSMLGARASSPEAPPVLALDVPTGIDADTGRAFDLFVSATVTVTFGLPKVGLFMPPGAGAAGDVIVADIGLPGVVGTGTGPGLDMDLTTAPTWLCTAAQTRALLTLRPRAAHKGDAGSVLLIGGSAGMTGAAMLMAQSAVLGGAGLVTLAVPAPVQPVVAAGLREPMTFALPCDETGELGPASLEAALRLAAGSDAVAVGPGLGRGNGTARFVRDFVQACTAPLVLDADGINAFAGCSELLAARAARCPLVITPHPGELARLSGNTVAQIQADRAGAARLAARSIAATCLLKGAGTVIADAGGAAWLIPAGNPGMASGGMGDVMTGLLAALWGQVVAENRDAACVHIAAVGAMIHAVAGDLAAQEIGEVGLRASDIAERLPRARHLLCEPDGAPEYLRRSLLGVAGVV